MAETLESVAAEWQPPTVRATDPLDPGPSRALAAVLDVDPPATYLPLFWHFVHFLEWARTSELGEDGHPREGPLLPPLSNRTRMFVGGRLKVLSPLRLAVPAQRDSAVVACTAKQGTSGSMLFVTVRHQIEQGGDVRLIDEQDLMYRSGVGARSFSAAGAVRSAATWQEPFVATEALLFRFSALTGNTHRIHYDHPYATDVERYPGLVVHGPLLALLMAGVLGRHTADRRVATFDYRFVRPCFAADHLLVVGGETSDGAAEMGVAIGDDDRAATASVTFS
jgi:3-methylfumaryl-CoA hydratase